MGRSQMPPLSLWLKGSETEPNAKSVPTSSHRNSFTHPCDHDQKEIMMSRILRMSSVISTVAETISLPGCPLLRVLRREPCRQCPS